MEIVTLQVVDLWNFGMVEREEWKLGGGVGGGKCYTY